MKKFIPLKAGLSVFLLLLASLAASQNPDSVSLSKRLSVLDDRASFQFPVQAKPGTLPSGLSSDLETQIIVDFGSRRMVFIARELFRLGTDSLLQVISAEKTEGMEFDRKILMEKDSLLAILSTPKIPDSTTGSILINSLIVRTPDNSLIQVDAVINPEAWANHTEFLQLSERIFSTLAKGKRSSQRQARTERVSILGTNKYLELRLPPDYAISVDEQYDFQVIRFNKYLPYGEQDWVSLTIYIGYQPSLFFQEYGFSGYTELQKSLFLGQSVEWYFFADHIGKVYLKEKIIDADQISKALKIHVAMAGNELAGIIELTGLVMNVKLTE